MTDEAAEQTTKKKATKRKTTTKTTRKAVKKKRPAATKAKKSSAAAAKLRVKQVRSTIRRQKTMARTLTAMGIKHHQDEVVVSDTPAMRGMLHKVRAFIQVTPEES